MHFFPDLEPVCCSMSSSNYCFLTCIQISQEAGRVVWYSHLFKNFPQFVVIHSQRFWNSQQSKSRCFAPLKKFFLLFWLCHMAWQSVSWPVTEPGSWKQKPKIPTTRPPGKMEMEIKRCLLFGRKAMINLDSILKSRDITLPTKVCIVRAMVFPVVMYGHASRTIKKAEHRRIDAFELWCWRRLLRVLWTARRSNQSILKEINPEFHWKAWCWSSNTLATWYEESIHWNRSWCWGRLKAGGEGDDRGWDVWMALLTQWTWVQAPGDGEGQGRLAKSWTWLSNWTTTKPPRNSLRKFVSWNKIFLK